MFSIKQVFKQTKIQFACLQILSIAGVLTVFNGSRYVQKLKFILCSLELEALHKSHIFGIDVNRTHVN